MAERVEQDSLGSVPVPADALWGPQTQRAVLNFAISGLRVDPGVIVALARIKAAAATANAEAGVLPVGTADAIREAAAEVAAGRHADQFPVDVFQTGSGTSTNMNVNEVLATLASALLGAPVHPNDHVNASQSSNDTVPTAIHLAVAARLADRLVPAVRMLADAFTDRARQVADAVKPGRTHLMDATPVTLGQEFHGYAAQLRRALERLDDASPRLLEVPLGGTAVGTGLNAPPGFAERAIALLRADTGLAVTRARDPFEAQSARDALVEVSGVLRTLAVSLTKICNDLRWMASGPSAGLGEIRLPALQPGSSIMPGKVNPVLPEVVLQVCAQVVGLDATVAWAGASGSFELNVMLPVVSRALLEQVDLLAAGCRVLAERCIVGIEPNRERMLALAQSSPAIVTPLARVIGYRRAAEVAEYAVGHGVTIRAAVEALGVDREAGLEPAELDRLLEVTTMLGPAPGLG